MTENHVFLTHHIVSHKREGEFLFDHPARRLEKDFAKFRKLSFADIFQIVCSQNFCNIHRKAPVLESIFNKVVCLQASDFIKNRLQHRYFLEEHLRVVASESVRLLIVFDHAEYKNVLIVHLSGFRVVMQKEVSRFFIDEYWWVETDVSE